MKKNIFKPFILILLALFITSCNNENFDNVFEDSASERLNEAIKKYSNSLTSAEQGWILEYYPEKKQSYGGYNFIIQFDKNKTSKVYSEITDEPFPSIESTYDVISYGGPVLTFNSYNTLMHLFATPSKDRYEGFGGDYEFLLMSEGDNTIQLKGNKTGNNMKLIKLNESPETYLKKVVDNNKYLKDVQYALVLNDKTIDVVNVGRTFNFKEENKDAISIAYIITDKGIKLYKPITLDGIEVSEFILNKETRELVSLDGKVIINILIPPVNMAQDWVIIDRLGNSDSFITKYNEVKALNTIRWGEELNRLIYFGNTKALGEVKPGIKFLSDGYPAQYLLNFSGVLNQPTQLNITKKGEGLYWNYYTHLEPLVDFIVDNAPYEAVIINDDVVRLVSTKNPDNYFSILK